MHGSIYQTKTLINDIKHGIHAFTDIDILILPTFVHLTLAHELCAHSALLLGAQNLYVVAQGAFTGEVSGQMLKELGCEYVLIGHSERRTIFKEDLAITAQKFQAAVNAGLKPILCIGETREEREAGITEQVIKQQLQSVIDTVGLESFEAGAVIAYEPVWAIGTGLTASPQQAQAVHAYIRQLIAQNNVDLASTIRILYGGSMKPENAADLLSMQDIDGGLIGGASLDANSFLAICAEASKTLCHPE